jgi:hypothetical protein
MGRPLYDGHRGERGDGLEVRRTKGTGSGTLGDAPNSEDRRTTGIAVNEATDWEDWEVRRTEETGSGTLGAATEWEDRRTTGSAVNGATAAGDGSVRGVRGEEFAERSPALKGWANFGCRCATAIVQTAQRSWTRIGEPCDGLIMLGLERGCLDGCKELNPGSLSAFLLSRSDYRL